MLKLPMTYIETPAFLRVAEKLITEEERLAIGAWIAENPESGVIMRETGGIRKLRWAREGQGKSGGFRIIYYYYSNRIPLFLLYMYDKGHKANLTREERNEMRKLTAVLAKYGDFK